MNHRSTIPIQDIYDRYTIPPILQRHMYTVTALGRYVAEAIHDSTQPSKSNIDIDLITQALLLHDMGNIVKFDLSKPVLIAEDELTYWQDIQKEFIEKYGSGDHVATINIVKELGVSQNIVALLAATADMETALSTLGKDLNFAIMFYADFRVGPQGVLSLDARIDDLLARYEGRHDHIWSSKEKVEVMRNIMKEQEAMLASLTTIPLSTLQNDELSLILKTLSSYPIDLNQALSHQRTQR